MQFFSVFLSQTVQKTFLTLSILGGGNPPLPGRFMYACMSKVAKSNQKYIVSLKVAKSSLQVKNRLK